MRWSGEEDVDLLLGRVDDIGMEIPERVEAVGPGLSEIFFGACRFSLKALQRRWHGYNVGEPAGFSANDELEQDGIPIAGAGGWKVSTRFACPSRGAAEAPRRMIPQILSHAARGRGFLPTLNRCRAVTPRPAA